MEEKGKERKGGFKEKKRGETGERQIEKRKWRDLKRKRYEGEREGKGKRATRERRMRDRREGMTERRRGRG